MNEKSMIKFIKSVMLSGDNPRGQEAEKNLKWGLKEFLKTNHPIKNELIIKAIQFGATYNEEMKTFESFNNVIKKFYEKHPEANELPKH